MVRTETDLPTENPARGARATIGDVAPKLTDITEDVLFGDIWERPQLSKRDRSLTTCAALVATGKTEQMSSDRHRNAARRIAWGAREGSIKMPRPITGR